MRATLVITLSIVFFSTVSTTVVAAPPCNHTLSSLATWEASVSSALANATNNDLFTLCLNPGTYTGCGSGVSPTTPYDGPVSIVGLGALPSDTVLDCLSVGRAISATAANTTAALSNLQITNGKPPSGSGGAVHAATPASSSSSLAFDRVWFTLNDIRAVYVQYCSVAFDSCEFRSNFDTTAVGGAALYVDDASVTASNCYFYNNTAQYGGAVVLWEAAFTSVNNTYYANTATGLAGAIDFQYTTLTSTNDNYTQNESGLSAGCLNGIWSGVIITRSNFVSNTAGNNGGGIELRFAYEQAVVFDSVVAMGNTANNDGGFADIRGCDNVYVYGNTLVANNSALDDTGGIKTETSNVTYDGVVFQYNYGFNAAGAVFAVGPGGSANLSSVVVFGNTADNEAAGVRGRTDVVMEIHNSSIMENVAGGQGGGIQIQSGSELYMGPGNVVSHNWANRGAALWLSVATGVVDGVVFENNYSNNEGGAVTLEFGAATVTGCVFEGNTVGARGGALAIEDMEGYISGCRCSGSSAGDRGGAIFLLAQTPFNISDMVIYDNTADVGGGGLDVSSGVAHVSNSTFERNSATLGAGGGVRCASSSIVTLTNCTVRSSSALTRGGAVTVQAGHVNLLSTLLEGSTTSFGGGLAVFSTGSAYVAGCAFENNVATTAGGGVDVNAAGAFLTAINSTFVNNTAVAGGNGGGLASELAVNVTDCFFEDNTAAGSGGGLYIDTGIDPANTTLTHVTVRNNGASVVGSGVALGSTSAVLDACDIVENVGTAATTGGLSVDAASYVSLQGGSVVAYNYWLESGHLPRPARVIVVDVVAAAGKRVYGYTAVQTTQFHTDAPRAPLCDVSFACNNVGTCSIGYTPSPIVVCNCTGTGYYGLNCSSYVCGDGLTAVYDEECDDGNSVGNDTCTNNCTLNCGNGVVDALEECDDGNRVDGDACDSSCRWSCGNGYVNTTAGEECDDGNRLNGDSCNSDCGWSCGDGMTNVTAGEECDDGNRLDGDACDSNCQWSCGNGYTNVTAGEECDDGNGINGDDCSNNCTLNCGNGQLDGTEECDDGNANNNDACRNDCTAGSVCGDGVWNRNRGEQCDDGNSNDGDACQNDCTRRRPLPDNRCANNEWRRRSGCEPCPAGGYCDGSTWCLPTKGHWSKSPYHTPIRCGVQGACPGSVDEDGNFLDGTVFDGDGNPVTAVCAVDYRDEVCARCEGSRFKDNQRCVRCSSSVVATTSGLVVVFSALIVVVAIAVVVLTDKQLDVFVSGLLAFQMFVLVGRDATRFVPGGVGDRASAAYRFFSVITLDLEFLQLGCSRGEALSFVEAFWGTLVLVGIAGIVFVAAALVSVSIRSCRGKLLVSFTESAMHRVVHVLVLLGMAAYVQVALRALQAVDCLEVDGETRLRVELSTRCYGGEHNSAAVVAWVTMAAYLVGFPVFVFYVAWRRPAALASRKRVSGSSSQLSTSVSGFSLASGSGALSTSVSASESGSGSGGGSGGGGDSASYGGGSGAEYSDVELSGGYEDEEGEEEEEQQSSSSSRSASRAPLNRTDAAELYAYKTKYGFLIRSLHRHAYWFQALRLAVLFVVVLELVTPRNTSSKLFGGVVILAVNVVVVGLVWPFKNRVVNLFQMGSGLVTAFQTVLFLQGVADPLSQSRLMFVLSLVLVLIVAGVMVGNMYFNRPLLLLCLGGSPVVSGSSSLSFSDLLGSSQWYSRSASSSSSE